MEGKPIRLRVYTGNRVMEVEAIEDVKIDLTFDPPWDMSKMSANAKIQLGLD